MNEKYRNELGELQITQRLPQSSETVMRNEIRKVTQSSDLPIELIRSKGHNIIVEYGREILNHIVHKWRGATTRLTRDKSKKKSCNTNWVVILG